MVLLHGGGSTGAERIAACWADQRKVPNIPFKIDWSAYAKAAPFKRNDTMLSVLPIGVLIFPSNSIQNNFADKARKLGIPLLDLRKTGGAYSERNDMHHPDLFNFAVTGSNLTQWSLGMAQEIDAAAISFG